MVCDARYEGPRDNAGPVAAALAAAARGGAGPGRLLPLLRALWLLVDARGEKGASLCSLQLFASSHSLGPGGGLEALLPPLWPACRGHPLMEALLLRCVVGACPGAPGVPELLRSAVASAWGYLLDDILHLWVEHLRRAPGERLLLPLLPPLLTEPAAWDLLAEYARAGALPGPVALPALSPGQAADAALVLRRLALLETLLAHGAGLAVPPEELLRLSRAPEHPAVRCRAAALACRAGLPVLPQLQELLPQLEVRGTGVWCVLCVVLSRLCPCCVPLSLRPLPRRSGCPARRCGRACSSWRRCPLAWSSCPSWPRCACWPRSARWAATCCAAPPPSTAPTPSPAPSLIPPSLGCFGMQSDEILRVL